MPDLKKMLTLEALSEALPSWLKRSTKPEYNADEIDSTLTTNQFVTDSDKDNWNAKGTYSKPSGGIPKSDLSSIVQTSLEKADSALQSETDPTVPTWAKQTNKPSYTQDEVADGTTYKRVSQTEKDTWSGKQNALTTTQMQAVNSGITAAGVSQIETNKGNISYTLGKTGRNHFDLDMSIVKNWNTGGTWNGNVYTQSGLTFTFNSDGTIDVSGTATARVNLVLDVYYPLNTEIGYRFNDLDGFVLSGCPTGGAWNKYSLSLQMTDSPWTSAASDTGNGATIDKSVLPSNATVVAFYLSIYASYPTSSFTFKPMFCTQEDWSVTHDYTPYQGLPNYDLTVLEAEDRAALAEEIDAGAKNKWDFTNAPYSNKGVTSAITSTSLTVTSNNSSVYSRVVMNAVLDAGTYVFSTTISNYNATKAAIGINSDIDGTNANYGFIDLTNTGNGKYSCTFTLNSKSTIYIGFVPNNTSAYASGSFTASNIMICTLADWNVSQKFVPYRPSLDMIYDKIPTAKYKRYACTAANTYEKVSELSFTVDAYSTRFISIRQDYGNAQPKGIAVCVSGVTPSSYSVLLSEDANIQCASGIIINHGSTAKTYDVYVSQATANTNGNDIVVYRSANYAI